jgi:hypothetical protein
MYNIPSSFLKWIKIAFYASRPNLEYCNFDEKCYNNNFNNKHSLMELTDC